ncbi:hypothetical protein PFI31113_04982 [Pandoraea fibrosis]|uniref:Uncharacterized protein n=1 Tax=Pandoraea fibrosis TaxID=1891094 RepID=A0A5E4Z443_9BURK|nr:hypothetical protein PFI31113_04982 [Pandoraea fibrosis]
MPTSEALSLTNSAMPSFDPSNPSVPLLEMLETRALALSNVALAP